MEGRRGNLYLIRVLGFSSPGLRLCHHLCLWELTLFCLHNHQSLQYLILKWSLFPLKNILYLHCIQICIVSSQNNNISGFSVSNNLFSISKLTYSCYKIFSDSFLFCLGFIESHKDTGNHMVLLLKKQYIMCFFSIPIIFLGI